MKNLILGVIFSFFITISSIASVSAGLNLPDEKKKRCTRAERKEKCGTTEQKSCCPSKDEAKKDCKKDKKSCNSKMEEAK